MIICFQQKKNALSLSKNRSDNNKTLNYVNHKINKSFQDSRKKNHQFLTCCSKKIVPLTSPPITQTAFNAILIADNLFI